MDPFTRLSFHVLFQAIRDAQRGERFSDDERTVLSLWASLAGLHWGAVEAIFARAAAGEAVIGKLPEPGGAVGLAGCRRIKAA